MKFEDRIEELMYLSGFNSSLSLLVGFQGPLMRRFRGKWYSFPYWIYSLLGDGAVIVNMIIFFGVLVVPGRNLEDRSRSAFPVLSALSFLFKNLYEWYYRPQFRNFIEKSDAIYSNDVKYTRELENYSWVLRFISWALLSLNFFMLPWAILPIIREYQDLPREFAVPVWLPFDVMTDAKLFFTVVVSEALGATFTSSKLIMFDNIYSCYITRQVTLAKYMGKKFQENLQVVEVSATGEINYRTKDGDSLDKAQASVYLKTELREWIIKHQEFNRLSMELQSLISPLLAVHFFTVCGIVCTDAFVVVTVDMEASGIFFCALFVLGNSLELLLICRMGDLITYETEILPQLSLGTHLHTLSKEVNQILQIILSRLQKTVVLSAFGVFQLNTDNFRSMMMSAYSFFTMLREMRPRYA